MEQGALLPVTIGRVGVWAALVFLVAALLSSCAPSRTPTPAGVGKSYTIKGVRYTPRADPGYDRTGLASWYGKRFHGRPTASGERFDERAMTAAHTTLPMGTRVRVTNLENGRAVKLRINDRGPFIRGRIIDVSRAAAAAVGFERKGLARVRVQNLARATGKREVARSNPRSGAERVKGGSSEASLDGALARFQDDWDALGRKLGRLFD